MLIRFPAEHPGNHSIILLRVHVENDPLILEIGGSYQVRMVSDNVTKRNTGEYFVDGPHWKQGRVSAFSPTTGDDDGIRRFEVSPDDGTYGFRGNQGMIGKANKYTGSRTIERTESRSYGFGHVAARCAVYGNGHWHSAQQFYDIPARWADDGHDVPDAGCHERVETMPDDGLVTQGKELFGPSHPRGRACCKKNG